MSWSAVAKVDLSKPKALVNQAYLSRLYPLALLANNVS
jgi:hypothetical protein